MKTRQPVLQYVAWWDEEFCAAIRAAMAVAPAEPAEIVADGYALDQQVRQAADVDVGAPTVVAVERAIAAMLAPIGVHFSLPLTGSVGPSFLQYRPGGFYRAHRDRADAPGAPEWDRLVSVVVFLNSATGDGADDGFSGGALRLYRGDSRRHLDIAPRAGMLVAFPSDTLHEVMPVTRGVRDVVVDWLY